MKRRMLLSVCVILLVAVLSIAGTSWAYLTAASSKVNGFIAPTLQTQIYENGSPQDGENVLAPSGNSAAKEVKIRNLSSGNTPDTAIDGFIRAMLVPSFMKDGNALAGNFPNSFRVQEGNQLIVSDPKGKPITLVLNDNWEDNWLLDEATGYFYHIASVAPDGYTEPLLKEVRCTDPTVWNSLRIEVLTDAVQAEGGAAQAAWGVTVTNGKITAQPNS